MAINTQTTGGLSLASHAADHAAMGMGPSPLPVTTWAMRPAAIDNVGRILPVSDVGRHMQTFVSDGLYWRPSSGRLTVDWEVGSFSSPITTFQSAASGTLSIPRPIEIKAGLIVPGSRVNVTAAMRRRGAAAAMTVYCTLGTTGNAINDSKIWGQSVAIPAATNADVLIDQEALFGASSTSFVTMYWLARNAVSTSNPGLVQSVNVNTAVSMYISFGVHAPNVADAIDLVAYRVSLEN